MCWHCALLVALVPNRAWVVPLAPARIGTVRACDVGRPEAEGGPDMLLMASMTALRDKELERARVLLAEARAAYDQAGGPTDEQCELLELIGTRVDEAFAPGLRSEAKRPPPPSKEELKERAAAKERGERALLRVISVFGDKSDGERFGKSLKLLEEARENFRRAGNEVERERDGVLGNLYAVIRAEEERSQRVAKLVRLKTLLELTKQKRKAETLGIDGDVFEESVALQEEAKQAAAEALAQATESEQEAEEAKEASMADDILSAWKAEGLDESAKEVDALQRQIEDLEDSIQGAGELGVGDPD